MEPPDISQIQAMTGLSDTKLARALGVTRQTLANWKRGRAFPVFAQNAIVWMIALRRVDPANDNLPSGVRVHL